MEEFYRKHILEQLSFSPNAGQQACIEGLCAFLTHHSKRTKDLFILRGYAGTGKTSLMAALVRAMTDLGKNTVLLAPTGRAAQVFSSYAEHKASTIHHEIYQQVSLGHNRFTLTMNTHKDALFIVDEVSMLSNEKSLSPFGSGNLLADLLEYVFSSEGNKLLFLGDSAQLPPVKESFSAALDASLMSRYGLRVVDYTLTEVARQSLHSGILLNATAIRKKIENITMPFHFEWREDIENITRGPLSEVIQEAYDAVGIENTMIITRSNQRANFYNKNIRTGILQYEEALCSGDRVMVVKNNYLWAEELALEETEFIANGDIFSVRRVRKMEEHYGFTFALATLVSTEYHYEIEVPVWIDMLFTDTPQDNNILMCKLFLALNNEYKSIKDKKERLKMIYRDEFFNALQIRFAYAVTCHKAQGGQWKQVLIDRGNNPALEENKEYFQWLYTSVTRGIEKVWLVNYPQKEKC